MGRGRESVTMTRGPTEPVETCLRCGNDTADRPDDPLRHRVQLVDAPRGRTASTTVWGQLCPACWTAVRRFLGGAAVDEATVPPLPVE